MRPSLSFQEDDWLFERKVQHVRWVVRLNDGSLVYQDDERVGTSAWIRLKQFLWMDNRKIVDFWFEWRNIKKEAASNAKGYFFSLGAAADFNIPNTFHSYLMGWVVDDNSLIVKKYSVPDLNVIEVEHRNIKDCSVGLIMN